MHTTRLSVCRTGRSRSRGCPQFLLISVSGNRGIYIHWVAKADVNSDHHQLKSWVRTATLAVATHSDHGCLDKGHWSLLCGLDAISHCSCAWDMVLVVLGRKGDHTDPLDQRYLASTVQTRLPTSSVSGRNIATPTDPVDRKIAIWCARARCVLSNRLGHVSVTPLLVSKLVICRQGVLLAGLSIH